MKKLMLAVVLSLSTAMWAAEGEATKCANVACKCVDCKCGTDCKCGDACAKAGNTCPSGEKNCAKTGKCGADCKKDANGKCADDCQKDGKNCGKGKGGNKKAE